MSACTNKEPQVKLETSMGDIVIKLYTETPQHRDNFIKLVDEGFYNGVLFHRVIADFMIQAGDPQSKTAAKNQPLGSGDVGYKIPAEFVYPKYYHKKGSLSAARQGDQVNPQKQSSGCQFYIVQGKVYDDQELDMMDQNLIRKAENNLFQLKVQARQDEVNKYRMERNQAKLDQLRDEILAEVQKDMGDVSAYKLTVQQRNDYKTVGGTPHLDGEYTVFGEVVSGLEVVDAISKVQTGDADRPIEDVKIIKATIVE